MIKPSCVMATAVALAMLSTVAMAQSGSQFADQTGAKLAPCPPGFDQLLPNCAIGTVITTDGKIKACHCALANLKLPNSVDEVIPVPNQQLGLQIRPRGRQDRRQDQPKRSLQLDKDQWRVEVGLLVAQHTAISRRCARPSQPALASAGRSAPDRRGRREGDGFGAADHDLERQLDPAAGELPCAGSWPRSGPTCCACRRSRSRTTGFPAELCRALGFAHLHVHGQKAYHGVAVLSKRAAGAVPHPLVVRDRA